MAPFLATIPAVVNDLASGSLIDSIKMDYGDPKSIISQRLMQKKLTNYLTCLRIIGLVYSIYSFYKGWTKITKVR